MKKVLLVLVALVLVGSGVAAVSAYEAHLINVTAHVENALTVNTNPLNFGTVFPQEWLYKEIRVQSSESFCSRNQTRVDSINYTVWAEWKPNPDMTAYTWNGTDWVPHPGYYDWMGYFTYVGIDTVDKMAANMTLVGPPPPGPPGAVPVLDSPRPIKKTTGGTGYNLVDFVYVAIDVPVFEGFYNYYTDPKPKPSGKEVPTWIVPDEHPNYDPEGMDFGLDLKIQVTNIWQQEENG